MDVLTDLFGSTQLYEIVWRMFEIIAPLALLWGLGQVVVILNKARVWLNINLSDKEMELLKKAIDLVGDIIEGWLDENELPKPWEDATSKARAITMAPGVYEDLRLKSRNLPELTASQVKQLMAKRMQVGQ